jgi:hypothetical protein
MSSTKTAGASTDFRTVRPEQFIPALTGSASAGVPDGLSDLFLMTGIELSADEFNELNILGEFLEHHIQPGGNRDVQCMLLWNEWVRAFRCQKSVFPGLIREQ